MENFEELAECGALGYIAFKSSTTGAAGGSKNPVAMVNEVLCKILCHNLTCLIQAEETLGIAPIFWENAEQEDGDRMILSIDRPTA